MLLGCTSARAAPSGPRASPDWSATPLEIPLKPSEALPASGTAGGYAFNLRPVGAGLGSLLADHGIHVVAQDLVEPMGSVSGGIQRGGFFEGYSSLGLDLDLARLAGIGGGSLHLLLSDLQGQAYYRYTGSLFANNRIYASSTGFRLNEFSYEQALAGGGGDVRLGRIPAYTQFDGSELYCTFLTDLCRTPAAYTFDRGSPAYLASSWAAIGEARLTRTIYVHAGIYENEPILAKSAHGGFPGPDWGLNYANGATIPVQVGYRTTSGNDPYPRAFSIGGFYNTGQYADPLLNAQNRNRVLAGGAARMDVGAGLIYLQAQQTVFRPDASDRGAALFGGADWAVAGQPMVERMIFGGAYWKGLFASRPHDTLGVAASYTAANPRVTEQLDSLLSRTTRGQASRGEVSYQAYYGVAVAPGMLVKPFGQFISHPDQASSSRPSGSVTHALVVGALLQIDAAAMFGLPTLVPGPSGR